MKENLKAFGNKKNDDYVVDLKLINDKQVGGNCDYKLYLPDKNTDYIQKEVFMKKIPYEYTMLQDILKRIPQGEVFVDIGANIGNHTLFIAANKIKVYAFEANKALCEIIQESVSINHFEDLVKIYNYGLSDKDEKASFVDMDFSNLGGNSLTLGQGDIECKRLDDFEIREKIASIKIDVEGMETKVLIGAKKTIEKNRPLIYIEAINQNAYLEIDELMQELGYIYFQTFNVTPTHLYFPEEKLNEKQILRNILAKNTFESYRMTQNLNYHKRSIALINNSVITLLKDQLACVQKNLEKAMKEKLSLEMKLSLEQQKTKREEERVQAVQNTLSFMWGNRLVKAKNLKNILSLPYGFYQDYKKFKQKVSLQIQQMQAILPKYRKDIHLPSTLKIFDKDIEDIKKVKIACIMDEFTYSCFKVECELKQLSPSSFKQEIQSFKPDFVFIESAWEGLEKLWTQKISNFSQELENLLIYCKALGIPTIFWNKEDPVHFEQFLPLAQNVDFVFTTDLDCVGEYKYYVGHTNVYCLPFAVQPEFHNPIEEYDRIDGFNFAGSYYLRYPVRQRDFKTLVDAVKNLKPVSIYDRNYDNPHPHYKFPQEYKDMVLGKLPFEQINKAYKGYKFGITLNTIKQSQTMFARRAFELLASNTLTISNYSKALRNFFGDLIISSDDEEEISRRLQAVISDELYYKKFRLLGLRKVMLENTYTQRLNYILSIVFSRVKKEEEPSVYFYAELHSLQDYEYILEVFSKQSVQNKFLVLLKNFEESIEGSLENIIIKENALECVSYLSKVKNGFLGILSPQDYYTKNYGLDLILARKYSKAHAIGKSSFYEFKDKEMILHSGSEYRYCEELDITSSIIHFESLDEKMLTAFILDRNFKYSLESMLGLDCFGYCKNARFAPEELLQRYIEDIKLADLGLCFEKDIVSISPKLPAVHKTLNSNIEIFKFSSDQFYDLMPKSINSKIKIQRSEGACEFISKQNKEEYKYVFSESFLRDDLNLVNNSQCILEGNFNTEDVKLVFEFQNENKEKISHSMGNLNQIITLAIPPESVYVKFGLRIQGPGALVCKSLIIDSVSKEPFLTLEKSKALILTKQYPSYDDIYKYGFLHSRVKAYRKSNVLVDIFQISNQEKYLCREFEDIDVVRGSSELLEENLRSGKYKYILVHLIDQNMWKVLEKFINKIKIIVWVHGAEIQVWQRREFNFENMSSQEIQRQKRLSDQRKAFWTKLINAKHKNLHFVFVSEHFKNESLGDLNLSLEPSQYSIIHNPIDTKLFSYQPKDKEQRKKILSIRPFSSKKYANDLSIKAILELSKKDFFKDLSFKIIG
ncbi:hypothetical protein DMB92_09090, partial [Campylobacter sp. MIT 99-7217]|uniref:FkbM family methyltransferase n=1 Tax=Campylobacter sp. MIT 99-7217 TaxID=535091 RepID=UPI00115B59C9